MKYILSIDQSTAGTKGTLFDNLGRLIARCDIPHRQIIKDNGWIEHDAEEILANIYIVSKNVIEKAKVKVSEIKSIGISNQRETSVCWDKTTGNPLYNAIVWQCSRAADINEEVSKSLGKDYIKEITGLHPSPYFSAPKFAWLLRNVEKIKAAYKNETLCCGTMDAWIVFKLTGNFKTDYSNASRTQLLNLNTLSWDKRLVEAYGLKLSCLPEICMSDSLFGYTDLNGIFKEKVPIHGVLGDSHAALLGNNCTSPGMVKATLGTGSSIMMNVGNTRPKDVKGAVTSLAWGMNGNVEFVLEGNVNYAGAVTKWLVEDLELLQNSAQAGEIAATVDNTQGVYLVPAFSGLGAPYFNSKAKAILIGMNRTTKKAHIVRAAEECIAYQIADVVFVINSVAQCPMQRLCVDGGPTRDDFLMQFQADMLGLTVAINHTEELSAAGAAYCAALGSKISTTQELFSSARYTNIEPKMPQKYRKELYSGWKNAVLSAMHSYSDKESGI